MEFKTTPLLNVKKSAIKSIGSLVSFRLYILVYVNFGFLPQSTYLNQFHNHAKYLR